MRRFGIAAVSALSGAVACGTIWGFEDPIPVDGGESDAAKIIDTPIAPNDPTRTCVPRPPADWQGPLIIFEGKGTPPPAPPPCPSGYRTDAVYTGNTDLVAPPAECACSCSDEQGADCAATVTWYKENTCVNVCPTAVPKGPLDTACLPTPAGCAGAHVDIAYTPGKCVPTKNGVTLPDATWTAVGRVCATSTPTIAGCAVNHIATPTTGLPFEVNTYCIAKDGPAECPQETYPNKRVYYAAITKGRDCGCMCDAPQGGACTGSASTSDGDCDGGKPIDPTDKCGATKKNTSFDDTRKTGNCTPKSIPSGVDTPTSPTTICCTR